MNKKACDAQIRQYGENWTTYEHVSLCFLPLSSWLSRPGGLVATKNCENRSMHCSLSNLTLLFVYTFKIIGEFCKALVLGLGPHY